MSAFTDFDGQRSFAGCQADFSDYMYQCDDTLAELQQLRVGRRRHRAGRPRALRLDRRRPVQTISGTSMAAPHVSARRRWCSRRTRASRPRRCARCSSRPGECPDGTVANAPTCAGHGQWSVGGLFGTTPDKDGIPEPLINALRAAQAAGTPRRRLRRRPAG